jgi:hypothetical protein
MAIMVARSVVGRHRRHRFAARQKLANSPGAGLQPIEALTS